MPRHTAILFILLALVPVPASAQAVPDLQINSERYIVIDAATGHVYAGKDAHDEVGIASLTKIFTAVQALEMAPPDTLITTEKSDLFGPSATVMGFGPGETYTLKDLIYGMMLPSGNDAAHAIARSLGAQPGDTPEEAVDRFMALVNQRVTDMGLDNTHLVTPSGWGVPDHYSSAWDVAAMMQLALQHPLIEEAISTLTYTTSNGLITLHSNNKLFNTYEALVGGKTGYDQDAGWCLIEVAERNGRRMIGVTLDGIAPDDWYDDNRVLLEYGFKQETGGPRANWGGDVVTWRNPLIAGMQRSATSDARLAGGALGKPAAPAEPQEVVAKPHLAPPPVPGIDAGNVAIALISLLAILAVRGTFAFNRWQPSRIDTDAGRG